MKLRFLLPGLLALVLLMVACVPPPNLRNEKYLRDDSLFTTDEDCAAPCWRGITPGQTAWDDARTMIEDEADFTDPQLQTSEDGPQVAAQWSQVDGEPCCQMYSEDGEIVSIILLQFAPNHTLGELIEAHGEPEYAVGAPVADDQAVMYLMYPEKSVIVLVFVAGANTGELSESSEVIGAFYQTPERMDLLLKTSSLYAWKGFEPFSAYAPDAENADFAITPSITLTPTPEG